MLSKLCFWRRRAPSRARRIDDCRGTTLRAAAWYIEAVYGEPTTPEERAHHLEKLREVACLLETMHVDGQRYRRDHEQHP